MASSGAPRCRRPTRPPAALVVLAAWGMVVGMAAGRQLLAQPAPAAGADSPRVEVSGAVRLRWEGRRDAGFDPSTDRAYLLTRVRGRLRVRLADVLSGVVEGQDARSPGLSPSTPSLRDPLDLHQGYLDLGRPRGPVRVRVGRQELVYGAERLLSRNNWRNTARSFDAVRLFWRASTAGVDLFGAAEVERDPTAVNPFGAAGDLYGVYGWVAGLPAGLRVEPYVLRRSLRQSRDRDRDVGAERRYTYGVRVVRARPVGLDVVTELAWQHGRSGPRRIGAWFGTAIVTYTADTRRRPRVMVELTEASGDGDAADGRSGTFHPMYPTGHAHFGFADIFSGRNLRDLRVGVSWLLTPRTTLRVDAHNFWASTPADGLYAPSLQLVVPPNGAGRPSRVGTELNLTVRWRVHPRVLVGGGYGHLFPGPMLAATTAGGAPRYPYALLDVAL